MWPMMNLNLLDVDRWNQVCRSVGGYVRLLSC